MMPENTSQSVRNGGEFVIIRAIEKAARPDAVNIEPRLTDVLIYQGGR